MMGHVKEWLCRYMLGIAPVAPGYDVLRIRPWLQEGMTRVRGSIFTVHGFVRLSCTRTENELQMQAEVPVGTRADVWVPCPEEWNCFSLEGEEKREAGGVRDGGYLKISGVPSGSYMWVAEKI